MPIEKRDANSKAKIFVPTNSERATRSNRREAANTLKELKKLKSEYEELVNKAKKEEDNK
jgi:hypothetical protein